jgi:predicted aspartyl protease
MWIGVGTAVAAHAQSSGAAVPVKKTCAINSSAPNLAETALNKGDYVPAEKLFREQLARTAEDGTAHEGLVRTLIEQDKVDDAAKDAEAWVAAAPENPMALTALGDVRLRQGDPLTARAMFQKAAKGDLCDARAYFGLAEVDELAGYHASSKRMIEQAYALHPTGDEINVAWIHTRQHKERLEKMADYALHSDQIATEDRVKLQARLAKESLYHASDCAVAPTSPRETKVPMDSISGLSRGLQVQFNGKHRELEIDTGASGITISRAAAMFLGITREDSAQLGGIGDKGDVKTSIAHVASVKIGDLEFTNCRVEILEQWGVLDSDGLIGGDVFRDWLLTLDFPKHELRVSPLPDRPGQKKIQPVLAEDDAEPTDPYVAPEMANWEHMFRSGSDLLIRTGIVEVNRAKETSAWKEKLFLLDTGAQFSSISPEAAKEVSNVRRNYFAQIRGISGDVKTVYEAGRFILSFAGMRQDSLTMDSVDLTKISHADGVEVAGILGAPSLFHEVIHIDYRDNLVSFEYKSWW